MKNETIKQFLVIVICFLLVGSTLTGCGPSEKGLGKIEPGESSEPQLGTATSDEDEQISAFGGGGSNEGEDSDSTNGDGELENGEETPPGHKSPPDCIWVLEGTVHGTVDIGAKSGMPGMIATYLFELQFINLSGEYPSGPYDGSIYSEVTMTADDMIKDLLKNVPGGMVNINFESESYAFRTGIPISIYNFWNFEHELNSIWPGTYDAKGNKITPTRDEYVAQTTVALPFKNKLIAGGEGDTGGGSVKVGDLVFDKDSEPDVEVRFVIEPNSVWGDEFYTSSTGTRKVKIYISDGEDWFEGEGTLTRQPGGLEKGTEFTRNHPPSPGERHGVEPTA